MPVSPDFPTAVISAAGYASTSMPLKVTTPSCGFTRSEPRPDAPVKFKSAQAVCPILASTGDAGAGSGGGRDRSWRARAR